MRLYLSFLVFLICFIAINIALLDNLRDLWNVSYPLVLVVINLDLLILVIVFMVFFRKFVKTYLAGRKQPLRRQLSTSLMLYIITPLIFLNITTAIVLLQSTKSFVSGQLKVIAKKTESLEQLFEEDEKRWLKAYAELLLSSMQERGLESLRGDSVIKDIRKDNGCVEEAVGDTYTLCVKGYRVQARRNPEIVSLTEDINRNARELRNMVKGRDIIGGIYLYFIVLAGFVSFLSAVWFGNLVARHISLPLERLSQKAREIARGNFEVNLEVPQSSDELRELSQNFISMKEELKRMYEILNREKQLLTELFDALPVGIVFVSKDGGVLKNKTYEELVKKKSVRQLSISLEIGELTLYEDLEAIILAERFRTWQMAVKRIAHEIKNPLTPISLNLERFMRAIQKGNFEKERLMEMVNLMLEEIERIRKVVEQFRTLSVDVEPEFKELELAELIQKVSLLYEDLKVEVVGILKVMGDERLLRDMLFNLFNNSLEWNAKSVRIELSEDRVVYKDDGTGIQEGKEELIFLPYHSENPKGMGLGLAIVKHIAELHGWKVRAVPDREGFHLLIELKSKPQ